MYICESVVAFIPFIATQTTQKVATPFSYSEGKREEACMSEDVTSFAKLIKHHSGLVPSNGTLTGLYVYI